MFKLPDLLDLRHSPFPFRDSFDYPWDALRCREDFFNSLTRSNGTFTRVGNPYIGENVIIGDGTVVEDGAMILGPTVIGRNCLIRHGAYIRDRSIIGNNVVIGNACEIKASIIFDGCEIPHFNYVGDSILGYRAHLGAGVKISNVKLVPGEITVRIQEKVLHTGLEKFGAVIGDYAQIGCNAVLNPGSIIGRNCVIYPTTNWQGTLPENSVARLSGRLEVRPLPPSFLKINPTQAI